LLLSRAGTRVKADAEVRLLNIPADAGRGMGLFEDIRGAESPRVFAEELKAGSSQDIWNFPARISQPAGARLRRSASTG
jgi:hypothetical protein